MSGSRDPFWQLVKFTDLVTGRSQTENLVLSIRIPMATVTISQGGQNLKQVSLKQARLIVKYQSKSFFFHVSLRHIENKFRFRVNSLAMAQEIRNELSRFIEVFEEPNSNSTDLFSQSIMNPSPGMNSTLDISSDRSYPASGSSSQSNSVFSSSQSSNRFSSGSQDSNPSQFSSNRFNDMNCFSQNSTNAFQGPLPRRNDTMNSSWSVHNSSPSFSQPAENRHTPSSAFNHEFNTFSQPIINSSSPMHRVFDRVAGTDWRGGRTPPTTQITVPEAPSYRETPCKPIIKTFAEVGIQTDDEMDYYTSGDMKNLMNELMKTEDFRKLVSFVAEALGGEQLKEYKNIEYEDFAN